MKEGNCFRSLTKVLGASTQVLAFNSANPSAPIKLLAKCEFANPGMSHKDRIAKAMLQRAEARGELTGPSGERKTILAASSGNTGCACRVCACRVGSEFRRAICLPLS